MRAFAIRRITGRHVLVALLAFFAIVVGVNGVFIYVSLTSWTGVGTESAYVRGLEYNRALEAATEQQALGWQTSMTIQQGVEGSPRLVVRFLDRSGRALDNLSVVAEFRRPTHEGDDRVVSLAAGGSGSYRASLDSTFRGHWKVTASTVLPSGRNYIVEQELWLE